MKTLFVSDLNTEQSISTFFLVCAKEIRNTKEGKPYLRMELGDRSGTIEARMWSKFETMIQNIARDDFVKVEGRVEVYRDKPQLAVLQVRKAKPEEIELADFLPHTKEDVEKMYEQLLGYAKIRSPWCNSWRRHPERSGDCHTLQEAPA
jgi:3'-5' exoribonuclease